MKISRTLNERFMTPFLKHAQLAEFKKLKNIVNQTYLEIKTPLSVLDIGVGNGRIPIFLSKESVWKKIALFVGFDNSRIEIKEAKRIIKQKRLEDKIKIIYFDATNLKKRSKNEIFKHKYDLVICTYFTAGNFKPDEIKIKTDEEGLIAKYPKSVLEPNKKFVKIFKNTYNLLKNKGKIILGTTYIDNNINRTRQEKFYKKCGMTIITSKEDPFTATKEGFWSQKFTKKRIYEYFSWIKKEKIKFIPLDDYNFARMVVISK